MSSSRRRPELRLSISQGRDGSQYHRGGTALNITGAGRLSISQGRDAREIPVVGEVFSLDIPFHRTPQVEKLIVCNPRRNASLKQGNKSDPLDARQLAHLLQANLLRPVYHEAAGPQTLQELARAYTTCVGDTTRVMNRIKARYRARGILCSGSRVYRPRFRQPWFEQLTDPGARQRVELLYLQLDLLQELRKKARRALLTEARRYPACSLLRTVPGVGPVRAALLLALISTPFRFRTKRQLWMYVRFGLSTRANRQ